MDLPIVWFTVADAVRYSRLSRSTLYILMKNGCLRPRKVGHKTLIARQDVDRLINGPVAGVPNER